MTRFEGCGTALVTPFTEDGELDLRSLRALVEWQIAEGIDFLVPCGSTGEAQTMTDREREQVVATVVEVTAGRVPVMAGATSNDTCRAVERDPTDVRSGRGRHPHRDALLQQAHAGRAQAPLPRRGGCLDASGRASTTSPAVPASTSPRPRRSPSPSTRISSA